MENIITIREIDAILSYPSKNKKGYNAIKNNALCYLSNENYNGLKNNLIESIVFEISKNKTPKGLFFAELKQIIPSELFIILDKTAKIEKQMMIMENNSAMNYTTEVTEDNKLIVSFPDLNGILIWEGSLKDFQKALLVNELKPSGKVTKSGKIYYKLVTSFIIEDFLENKIEEEKTILNPKAKTTKSYNSDKGKISLTYEGSKLVEVLFENSEKNSKYITSIISEEGGQKRIEEQLLPSLNAVEIKQEKKEFRPDLQTNKSNNLTADFFSNISAGFKIENKKDFSGGRVFFSINGIITLIEKYEKADGFQSANKLVIQHSEDRNSEFYMSDLRDFVQNENLQAGDFVAVDFYINCVKSSKSIWFNNFVIKSIKAL